MKFLLFTRAIITWDIYIWGRVGGRGMMMISSSELNENSIVPDFSDLLSGNEGNRSNRSDGHIKDIHLFHLFFVSFSFSLSVCPFRVKKKKEKEREMNQKNQIRIKVIMKIIILIIIIIIICFRWIPGGYRDVRGDGGVSRLRRCDGLMSRDAQRVC